MSNPMHDSRFTLGLEYCGDAVPKFILRFCGDWLSRHDTYQGGLSALNSYKTEFESRLIGDAFKVLASESGILSLLLAQRLKVYKVVYGSQVREFKDLDAALYEYSSCLSHLIGSQGE